MAELRIDEIQPSSLRLPIGAAIARIEECVEGAYRWRLAANANDGDSSDSLEAWVSHTATALRDVFQSKAPVMSFLVSEPEFRVVPASAMTRTIFNRRCEALLRQREDLLDLRERVSLAAADLADQLARHEELLRLMRGNHEMTEAVWSQVVVTPSLASPVSRLTNFGLTQNAIWDLIKMTFGAIF